VDGHNWRNTRHLANAGEGVLPSDDCCCTDLHVEEALCQSEKPELGSPVADADLVASGL